MKRRNFFAGFVAWFMALFSAKENKSISRSCSFALCTPFKEPLRSLSVNSAWTPWDGLDDIVRKYNELPAKCFSNGEKVKLVHCEYHGGNNVLDESEFRTDIDRKKGEVAFVAVFYREPMSKHDAEIRETIRDMKAKGRW